MEKSKCELTLEENVLKEKAENLTNKSTKILKV